MSFRTFQLICSCLLIACLTSCASQPAMDAKENSAALQIAGVEIYNGLAYTVKDVTILVPVSGDYMSCGQILSETSCSTGFPLRENQGNKVQVTWTEQGAPHSTPEFSLEPPEAAVSGQRAYIRVEIFATGQAGAKLLLLPLGGN